MQQNRSIILFAVLYSACLTCSRHFIILLQHWETVTGNYPIKVLIGGITEFAFGLLLGGILFIIRKKGIANIFFLFCIGPILLIEIASFHYEAVFGRLPSSDLLFYFSELRHLSPSLAANIPVYRVVFEFTLVMLVLYYGIRSMRMHRTGISPGWGSLTAVCLLLLSVLIQSMPSLLPEHYFWSGRQPLLWLVQSHFVKESYKLEEFQLTGDHFKVFRQLQGKSPNEPLLNPDYPICAVRSSIGNQGNGRSVILLILEGISREEMYGKYRGNGIMPNLQRIAGENLEFRNFFSPGTKSVTSLPAIFSGLPGNPFNNYLWNDPAITLTGFPEQLNRQGYDTVYFHGGDLSFERQRIYLNDMGFKEIVEYDPAGNLPVYGWGYDDSVMFKKLADWLTEKHQPGEKFLATLFTLSTHDPYTLPNNWQLRYPDDEGVVHDLVESYMYLDQQLGEFYDWYRLHGDNAILVITGDHAPHIVNEGNITENYEMRFDVPLIIAGLTAEELKQYRSYSDRVAGSHDIPATIMDLLGLESHSCNLGVSLVQPEASWPVNRVVYAFGGDTLERMHLWFNDKEVVFDRLRKQYRLANRDNRAIRTDSGNATLYEQAKSYVDTIFPVHYYLLQKNRYAIRSDNRKFKSIQGLAQPLIISHRGNINGESEAGMENSAAALDAILTSAFNWVEVDVQLTSDGELVLLHDPTIVVGSEQKLILDLSLQELRSIPAYSDVLTLEQAVEKYSGKINMLIEIKPQEHIKHLAYLSREVVRILSTQPDKQRFIVDSFHEYLASSIKNGCNCQVGFDTEYTKKLTPEDLEFIAQMKLDWVYAHYSVVNSELIHTAHEHGIKVMAYTVNDGNIIQGWKSAGILPDGIITDNEKMIGVIE
ncbi:MAG: sulfatase-like hydrolase/transferase [Gammaproteobacteria bacterium]|nr:sulfatase-like hydrolase/transferase [Gammaproteobacteria bacterium]